MGKKKLFMEGVNVNHIVKDFLANSTRTEFIDSGVDNRGRIFYEARWSPEDDVDFIVLATWILRTSEIVYVTTRYDVEHNKYLLQDMIRDGFEPFVALYTDPDEPVEIKHKKDE